MNFNLEVKGSNPAAYNFILLCVGGGGGFGRGKILPQNTIILSLFNRFTNRYKYKNTQTNYMFNGTKMSVETNNRVRVKNSFKRKLKDKLGGNI